MDAAERPAETIAFLRENMYERMDAFVAVNEDARREFHLQRYRFAAEELKAAGVKGSVLDAACGTGYGSKVLLEACDKYVGVDVAAEAVEYARKFYGGERARFECGDAGKLGFLPDASLDAVVSFETIEHLERDLETLAEFRRVLKPGGLFVSSVPNRWPLTLYHVNDYDARTYRLLLERHFEVLSLHNQTSDRPVSDADLDKAECLLAVCRAKAAPDLDAASARAVSLNQIDNLIKHKKRLEAEVARARRLSLYRFSPLYHALRRIVGMRPKG
ncbi:MAG: class I SAM-dependent methyltransferase [Elusimicrobia bacterium]|nr:class I SAM-dependent methyltransferase [Elusimicrobiota bacterium]